MCSCVGEQADLSKPETIIGCATGHPEEPVKKRGWEGKVALIQCVKAMGIQKFVFYSIHNCDKHPEVPLMDIKYFTEKFLQDSGINYIVIHLCGFMQGLSVFSFLLIASTEELLIVEVPLVALQKLAPS